MIPKHKSLLKIMLFLMAICIIITGSAKVVSADTILKQNNYLLQTSDLQVNKVIVSANIKNVYDTNATLYNKVNNKVVNYAYSFLGKPYVYGASGPNAFDCSGFTKFIYNYFSKELPRTSEAQYNSGKKIDRKDIQTGDLVFFNTDSNFGHVGIYIGDGDFIHASSSKGVTISSLNDGYYNDKYAGAVRY